MKKIDELLGELMQAAYKCNKHDVFVNYSPHVKSIEIRIFIGGWGRSKTSETHDVHLYEKNAKLKIKAWIDYIKHLGGESK